VVRRGKVESEVTELVSDLRNVMSPYTALNFREDTKNTKLSGSLAHYAKEMTGPLGVTHILSLSQNAHRLSLRLARTPAGPTLTFKIPRFSLARQVRAVQRRPFDTASSGGAGLMTKSPIVVTNNFGDAGAAPHVKLMRITFQNMFPAINVATVKLADCRRVVLFNFIRRDVPPPSTSAAVVVAAGKDDDKSTPPPVEEEDEEVEIRHYAIRAQPTDVSTRVRRLVQSRIPDLSRLDDISDYITGTTASGAPAPCAGGGGMSDSEAEEDEEVVLPQDYAGRGNGKSRKSGLKLVELGPRVRMKLSKVERGLAGGDVMYHAYVRKDPEEVKKKREEVENQKIMKKRRREEQEENVRRKKEAEDNKREGKRMRREEKGRLAMEELRKEVRGGGGSEEESGEENSTDGSEDVDNE